MTFYEACKEFQNFAEKYNLLFAFKEDRDIRHYEPEYYELGSPIDICLGIKYTFRFTNPATKYVREFVINHDDFIRDASEFIRNIKNAVEDDVQLLGYPVNPKQIYITTVNSHNLQTSLYDKFRENPGFTQRFEIDEMRFYDSPEWRKQRKQLLELSRGKKEKMGERSDGMMKVKIEKVYFNAPYTIVIWSDKTKTMVKAENENYDPEKGLAMAICKKFLGTNNSRSNYFDEFKKWLPKIDGGPVKEENKYRRYVTVKEFAELSKVDISTVRKHCRMGIITGAIKQSGVWLIPIKPREVTMDLL